MLLNQVNLLNDKVQYLKEKMSKSKDISKFGVSHDDNNNTIYTYFEFKINLEIQFKSLFNRSNIEELALEIKDSIESKPDSAEINFDG